MSSPAGQLQLPSGDSSQADNISGELAQPG